MCGILGVVAKNAVNQVLYDGLLVLQHRGQDAAGIVTAEGATFHMHKGGGMVRDVFRTRNMRGLLGACGIGHTRYPTAGSAWSAAESQPFYVNSPFGLVLGHNGNLTNTDQLKSDLFRQDLRHVNTNSDSEVLLNVLAHELQEGAANYKLDPATIFAAVSGVHRRCRGAYAVVAMIAGYGLLAFRDPYGIRPLIVGKNEAMGGTGHVSISASRLRLEDGVESHEAVLVQVSDDGPGIPADVAEKVFDPFFTTKPQGSGLGLAIVRKIVDAHDGRIDLRTAVGQGTTIRVTLPVTGSDED